MIFVKEMTRVKNDPSFSYSETVCQQATTDRSPTYPVKTRIPSTTTLRTDVKPDSRGNGAVCAIHGTSHRLSECRAFEAKSLEARKNFLRDKGLCFKCCDFQHKSRHCREKLACSVCGSDKYTTVMHGGIPQKVYGGEARLKLRTNIPTTVPDPPVVECTEICGGVICGKSCAKI